MNLLMDILRGALIGVANIIPGVSGGTMMVTMGIYDKLLGSINGLFRQFKQSVKTLLPYFIGMLAGIAGFAFLLTKVLLVRFPLPTAFAFIGLIVGGIPLILQKLKAAGRKEETEKAADRAEAADGKSQLMTAKDAKLKADGAEAVEGKSRPVLKLFVFALFFALIIAMQFLNEGTVREVKPSVATAVVMFGMGAITSSAMVVPGVSGSLILLAIGYYNSITAAITDFISALKGMEIAVLLEKTAILFPFGLGVLFGIFFVAKLMEWLLSKHGEITYYGILGLVAASPVPVFLNAISGLSVTAGAVVASVITFFCGAAAAFFMSRE